MSGIHLLGHHSIKLFLALALVLTTGCSLWSKTDNLKNKDYRLNYKPVSWSVLPPEGSDHAFSNTATHSIITINSLCGRYEATNLRQLTFNILGGLDQSEILESQTVSFNGRDALRSKAEARIDGVPVALLIKTTRKNDCIYDFMLISPNSKVLEADTPEFDKILNGIHIP